MELINIQYRFLLHDGRELGFKLRLDPHSIEAVEVAPDPAPAWTALGFFTCGNCPLEPGSRPYCPAALRLVKIVDKCAGLDPYAQAQIEVTTPERSLRAARPLHKGLASLVGLIMATSGCPHTAFLKPMARFHLPFASDEEALYRASSMYLLAQYFLNKQGRTPDLELDGLAESYRKLQAVNTAMANRLRAASKETASQAIASLDLFSHILPYDIKGSLAKVRRLFEAYL